MVISEDAEVSEQASKQQPMPCSSGQNFGGMCGFSPDSIGQRAIHSAIQ